MRICILQFAPELRAFEQNTARADHLLRNVKPGGVDLLVLPELAFSGYNFSSLKDIRPFLEPTGNGPTAKWARETAARLNCHVTVGYPEISSENPIADADIEASRNDGKPLFKSYNAALTISPSGELVAHYRKSNLYYTDVSWSWPNPIGFETIDLNIPSPSLEPQQGSMNGSQTADDSSAAQKSAAVPTTFAICMDLNPKQFTAPWEDYEVATHMKDTNAKLLIATNAWITRKTREELEDRPGDYDEDTLNYWLARLRPLLDIGGGWRVPNVGIENGNGETAAERLLQELTGAMGKEQERIIVLANRVGIEPGLCRACDLTRGHPPDLDDEGDHGGGREAVEREVQTAAEKSAEPTAVAPEADEELDPDVVALEARYAGSSCVLGLRGDGKIRIYGQLGRAEEKLLVVNTEGPPEFVAALVSKSEAEAEAEAEE